MQFNETLMTCVRKDLDNNLIPMLLGEPGIGKSSWLENLATLMRTKCFTLACNQLADKADLTGARLVPVVDADGSTTGYKQVFYPHAVIHDAIAYANEHPRETPILFLDELNRTTPDVTSEALSIPTMRAIGSTQLPPNLRVVIAGNDKGNVTSLDQASISRFVLYRVSPDVTTFLGLDDNLNEFVRRTLNAHPETIFCKSNTMVQASTEDEDEDMVASTDIDDLLEDDMEMAQITTPRTIMGVSRWLNSCTHDELRALLSSTHMSNGQEVSTLQEVLEGHIGATQFCTYLLAEIINGLQTASATAAQNVLIVKPNDYDTLSTFPTMSDLENYISAMDDKTRAGHLIYAMTEKQDNTKIISAISRVLSSIDRDDVNLLIRINQAGQFDSQNLNTFLNSGNQVAQNLSMFLGD